MIGLQNAGKSTLLLKLGLGDVVSTRPADGFEVETVQHPKTKASIHGIIS